MKRKLIALITAVLLLVTMATPAFADLIWEPLGNDFYEKHRNECEYVNRAYLANGREGYVTIRKAPDSSAEIMNVANGITMFINFVWTDKDGVRWGVGYPAGAFDSEGWVPLSDLAMIYDYRDFEEDHSQEFKAYDGCGDALTEACAYSYPGGVFESKLKSWGDNDFTLSDCFDVLYTDENGLRWSYVGYYYGHRNCWVCIDDPQNEDLGTETVLTVGQVRGSEQLNPSAEPPAKESDTAPTPTEETTEVLYPPAESVPPAKNFPLWVIPVALVVVVAVFTAVIVRKRRA